MYAGLKSTMRLLTELYPHGCMLFFKSTVHDINGAFQMTKEVQNSDRGSREQINQSRAQNKIPGAKMLSLPLDNILNKVGTIVSVNLSDC
jgi:hypothetical protein